VKGPYICAVSKRARPRSTAVRMSPTISCRSGNGGKLELIPMHSNPIAETSQSGAENALVHRVAASVGFACRVHQAR
jgi:hypothetical protein